MAVVVEREQAHLGWRIREDSQEPGTGMIVTDTWLLEHGFGSPRRSNLDAIIQTTIASAFRGYRLRAPRERDVDPEGLIARTKFYRTGAARGHQEERPGEEIAGAVRSSRRKG